MNSVRLIFLAFLVSACASSPEICPANDVSVQQSSLSALSEKLLREHQQGVFSGTIMVHQQGSLLLDHSFGCADRGNGLPNTRTTVSDIGSVAKTFTAAAILQLKSSGKIKLSDKLETFYPSAPKDKADITIQQLLTHASGLDNFHNETDFDKMTRDEAERRILSLPMLAKPGAKIAYSNAGYTLLAAILERVSGQNFQTYVQENILAPLGLSRTGFYGDAHLQAQAISKGYGGQDAGRSTFEKDLTWALVGAGGMVSTPEDLLAWARALRDNAQKIGLDQASLFDMQNPKWSSGSWGARTISDMEVLQMGGSTDYGFTALVQYLPQKDMIIVIAFNGYSKKYTTATHHSISRKVIIPHIAALDKAARN